MDIEFNVVKIELSDGSFVHNVVAVDGDDEDRDEFVLAYSKDETTANFYSALLQHVTYEFEACETLEEKQRYMTKILFG